RRRRRTPDWRFATRMRAKRQPRVHRPGASPGLYLECQTDGRFRDRGFAPRADRGRRAALACNDVGERPARCRVHVLIQRIVGRAATNSRTNAPCSPARERATDPVRAEALYQPDITLTANCPAAAARVALPSTAATIRLHRFPIKSSNS